MDRIDINKINRDRVGQDKIGQDKVRNGFDYNVWGGTLADQCTANQFYGC